MRTGIAIEVIGNGLGIGLQMIGYINPLLGWTIIGVSTIGGLVLIILGLRKRGSKSLQTQNQLSVGELLGWVHAHKCSKCGQGIKVNPFKKVVTCPKCGNVDNVNVRNDAKTGNQ